MARILLTVPVWNEAFSIETNLRKLVSACEEFLPIHDWLIEVVDNGSDDTTCAIVQALSQELSVVTLRQMAERGKGGAIRASWLAHQETYDVFLFLDADLAVDLRALPQLISPILAQTAEIVVGSRYISGSKVERSFFRSCLSRFYYGWQQLILQLPVRDAQCGFKAVSRRTVKEIVPLLRERRWLFDTELLAYAHERQFRVLEIPVDWVETRLHGRRSALHVWRDGWEFIVGVWRIRKNLSTALR